jgi:hypothetical protein
LPRREGVYDFRSSRSCSILGGDLMPAIKLLSADADELRYLLKGEDSLGVMD